MAHKLKNLIVDRVDLVDKGANPDAHVLLFKRDVPAAEPPISEEAIVADESIETVAKADYDTVVAERDALKAQLAESTPEETEINKSDLPESVQKALAEADELRARVEKMEQERRTESFVAKARGEYEHIGTPAEVGAVLETVDRLAPETGKVLDQILKAANARIDASKVFGELGSSGTEDGDEASALIAKAMNDDKTLTRHDAIRKVFAERPDLWQPTKA